MQSSKEIRQQFIDFFIGKEHSFVPSSPVVPIDDPTLLFANAGMNQFKNIFLGLKEITYKRAVNSQKCIRAGGKHNDLEEVGKDGYHHTFFEMLGNWSFGDYYKKEAITWAWELLTDIWGLPKDKLHATVHISDNEAYGLWKSETDIKHEHISYHGDKDNFWEMGETGPCGPCSEIHIDRGTEHCEKQGIPGHNCQVNGDCSRYIELWNLVFIQYNRESDRSLSPLKHKFVDTGAGLERITQVLQNKNTNYETDLFLPIIERIAFLSKQPYNPDHGMSHRVIADHVRCLCFALADGGFPSNEGRGYVLRRLLRRAARHGRLLGFAEPFMHLLVDTVIEVMGHHYTELKGKDEYIKMVIKAEEERFNKTLDTGLEKFNDICVKTKGTTISGLDAFTLYDTYGFPMDLTSILAEEKGLQIDTAGFNQEMEAQRTRARNASKFTLSTNQETWIELNPSTPTEFTGYTNTGCETQIQRYSIDENQNVLLQLAQTPFYAESGGQVADAGRIHNEDVDLCVFDVRKQDEYIIHYCTFISGTLSNKPVRAEIEAFRRKDIARNHTATHLLHKALKTVLGEHVQQKGSLVHPDHLRFDFAHFQALKHDDIASIERIVNNAIMKNHPLHISVQSIETAVQEGAVALFGEKYGDQVRVVSVEGFSKELCGGTHVSATGEIGLFKISSEGSSAAGIRRIEAITGRASLQWVASLQDSISKLANRLQCPVSSIESKVESLFATISEMETTLQHQRQKTNNDLAEQLLGLSQPMDGFTLISQQTHFNSLDEFKQLSDILKAKAQNTLILLFNAWEDKLNILCVVSSDLLSRFHAGKLVSMIASLLDGKGGGRPDVAMAGGKSLDKLSAVMQQVPDIVLQFTL